MEGTTHALVLLLAKFCDLEMKEDINMTNSEPLPDVVD